MAEVKGEQLGNRLRADLQATGEMKSHFGTANSFNEDHYYVKIGTATASSLGVGNQAATSMKAYTISTQAQAQKALQGLNNAVIAKDKIRASLGAFQNRLGNSISNLQIQAENLQSAGSRMSDADVATEMADFVRNQVLTQAAVAMLSQTNALPQMALTLMH